MTFVKVKNPSAIIRNINPEAILISGISIFPQKIKTNKGDKGKSIDGEPKMPCRLKGNGKIAAPNIEKEKVNISKIGIVFNSFFLAILKSPMIKNKLKSEQITRPVVKMYCVFVPIVPNSLTILVR